MQKDIHQYRDTIRKRYFTVVELVNEEYKRAGFTEPLADIIHDMGFDIVYSGDIGGVLAKQPLKMMVKRKFDNLFIHILKGEKYNYIHINTPFDEYLLIDKKIPERNYKGLTTGVFLFILLVFIFIAYKIYKKLYPLNELKQKINDMGDGDIEFEYIKESAKDEVSLLAKEFKKKSQNLKKIKEARNVFIRNIMHELKTPITKGRFLVELPETEQNKEKLKQVFFQLESLINEFASIEEVISKNEKIEKREYFLSDVVDNALDKLMIDEDQCSYEPGEMKIKVNFKLFTIAVKNLIDNGIKYSRDKKVGIRVEKNNILFINSGSELEYPLAEYFEPFFNTESNGSGSFGLGLYIVNSILNAHGFNLSYRHENGKNIFQIVIN